MEAVQSSKSSKPPESQLLGMAPSKILETMGEKYFKEFKVLHAAKKDYYANLLQVFVFYG